MLAAACLCRNAHSVRSVAVSYLPGASSTRAWSSYSECDARCSASHCSLIKPRLAEFTPSGTRLLWMMTTAINTMTAPTMNCIRLSPKSRWTHRKSLELPEPLQRGASQPLGITRDGMLPLPLDAGHSAIECSDKLSQLAYEGLV